MDLCDRQIALRDWWICVIDYKFVIIHSVSDGLGRLATASERIRIVVYMCKIAETRSFWQTEQRSSEKTWRDNIKGKIEVATSVVEHISNCGRLGIDLERMSTENDAFDDDAVWVDRDQSTGRD